MSVFTKLRDIREQLNDVSIRVSEVNEIMEMLENSDCESADDVRNLLEGIWETHYIKENQLLDIESELENRVK